MIQFSNMAQQAEPDNMLTEDGLPISASSIRSDKLKSMKEYFSSKISSFERALSVKCKEEDVRLAVQNHPQVGRLYIVGPQVFTIRVDSNEISWSRIQ